MPMNPDPDRRGEDTTPLDVRRMIEEILALATAEAKRQLNAPMRAIERPSDLAQSVVLELLRKDGELEFRGDAALRALVKTMVVARVTQRARHHLAQKRDVRRHEVAPSGTGPDNVPVRAGSPASVAMWREMVDRAEAEILRLGARERRVLEMGARGCTAKEIAAAEGVTESNAQKLLWRCRQTIGKCVFGETDGGA